MVFSGTIWLNNFFLPKLYFPVEFGYCKSSEKIIESGGLIKTGLEYRINKDKANFVRFNYDNRNNRFKIPKNQTTNAVNGKLNFNDDVDGFSELVINSIWAWAAQLRNIAGQLTLLSWF